MKSEAWLGFALGQVEDEVVGVADVAAGDGGIVVDDFAAGGEEVALGLFEVFDEEFEDGAQGWGFFEVEPEGGGVEADEVGSAEEDGEAEVALVEAGGGAEVGDLKDDLGGSGHGSVSGGDGRTVDVGVSGRQRFWWNCDGESAKCRDLVHTRSRRSATGRIGYKDCGTDALIFPVAAVTGFSNNTLESRF